MVVMTDVTNYKDSMKIAREGEVRTSSPSRTRCNVPDFLITPSVALHPATKYTLRFFLCNGIALRTFAVDGMCLASGDNECVELA